MTHSKEPEKFLAKLHDGIVPDDDPETLSAEARQNAAFMSAVTGGAQKTYSFAAAAAERDAMSGDGSPTA